MPCFAYPVANPCKSLIYRIPSLPPYTAYPHFPPISFPRRLHLHLRPFLPLLFRACSLPPRCSSFFLSHFSTPFPVSSREYKKGWAHECLVTLSAFLIPPPYPLPSLVPHAPLCLSISLLPWITIYIYLCLLFLFFSYFSFSPFFSVRFWLRGTSFSLSLSLCTL